ncbi:MAG: hypothetical protein DVB30_00620 [Verrucomicrobia bacterium]|nr:MAG: hypothetical protein DVB30_00620 [Verrucomicrobiota bacterium]
MTGRVNPLRVLFAILFLGIAGSLILPWLIELQHLDRSAHFRSATLDLGLRERVGQAGFIAALSGFRAPVAAILWISAHGAWEKTEWGKMAALFDSVTALQPRVLLYWDIAAWHMAWNARASALQDLTQPSEVLRERSAAQYVALGRDFLERGIKNNPDQYLLYESLGRLAGLREVDHGAAADAYAKAASFKNAPPYLKRLAAYESSQTPGSEREAYDRLLSLYREGMQQRVPTLVTRLHEFEQKLGIPKDQWIDDSATRDPSNPLKAPKRLPP